MNGDTGNGNGNRIQGMGIQEMVMGTGYSEWGYRKW